LGEVKPRFTPEEVERMTPPERERAQLLIVQEYLDRLNDSRWLAAATDRHRFYRGHSQSPSIYQCPHPSCVAAAAKSRLANER
jgi:hypothetical protein